LKKYLLLILTVFVLKLNMINLYCLLMVKTIRNRYIAFKIKSQFKFTRIDIISAFKKLDYIDNVQVKPWLISFENNIGIVRCIHTEKDHTIKAIRSIKKIAGIDAEIETLLTSGTIRALKEKTSRKHL